MRLRRTTPLAILVLAVCAPACKRRTPPSSDGQPFDTLAFAGDASIAQPGEEDARKIAFSIDAVYSAQKPSDKPPFHEAGGTWTFFDATTKSGARFGYGFDAPKDSTSPFATRAPRSRCTTTRPARRRSSPCTKTIAGTSRPTA